MLPPSILLAHTHTHSSHTHGSMSHHFVAEHVALELSRSQDGDAAKVDAGATAGVAWPPGCDKLRAGLLIIHRGSASALLLQRSKKSGNPLTWGLAGGNVDKGDASLMDAARREAIEEVGSVLPGDLEVVTEVVTRRGKRKQKWFTVFVCAVDRTFEPDFAGATHGHEHVDYRWVPLVDLAKLPLHPVVRLVFDGGDVSPEDLTRLVSA